MTDFLNPRIAGALLALTLALMPGCKPPGATAEAGHDHDHGGTESAAGGHEHEKKTAQLTVWTERYEVFAEFEAPVAGAATTFVTHVTDLVTSEPRREGTLKVVIRQGTTTNETSQAAPARPGIYLPDITFPRPGDWQVTLRIPTDGTEIPVELGTVKVYEDQHAAEHADIPEAPEGVSFLKEQQWRILSRAEPVTRRPMSERLRLPAQVRPKPGNRAVVTAPVGGQWIAVPGQALAVPGQAVVAGQVLGLLKPNFSEATARLAEAEADFATAKAALDQAEAALARTRKLALEQAKSPREVQEAELVHASATARYGAAAGLLGTFRQAGAATSPDAPLVLELRAPIAGLLSSISAGPGEVVTAGQAVFQVLNPAPVWIEAPVPESSVGRLGASRDALIEGPAQAGPFQPIQEGVQGRFVSLGLEVDPATRTVPLIYEVANADHRLRPGQWVNLHVETSRSEEALAIPDHAIVEEGGRPIAFVQISGETFEKRDLTLGLRDGNWVQVLSGLSPGERVVTRGAYAVRLASVSSSIPSHGHAH